jgi:hypothetical protein
VTRPRLNVSLVSWAAEITDTFPGCSGKVQFGPYATRAEAQSALDRELADGRACVTNPDYLSGRVFMVSRHAGTLRGNA